MTDRTVKICHTCGYLVGAIDLCSECGYMSTAEMFRQMAEQHSQIYTYDIPSTYPKGPMTSQEKRREASCDRRQWLERNSCYGKPVEAVELRGMTSQELDLRINDVTRTIRQICCDLECEEPCVERAVALGALLGCYQILQTLCGLSAGGRIHPDGELDPTQLPLFFVKIVKDS